MIDLRSALDVLARELPDDFYGRIELDLKAGALAGVRVIRSYSMEYLSRATK